MPQHVTITLAQPAVDVNAAVAKALADQTEARTLSENKRAEKVKLLSTALKEALPDLDEEALKALAAPAESLVTLDMPDENVKALAAIQAGHAKALAAQAKLKGLGYVPVPGDARITVDSSNTIKSLQQTIDQRLQGLFQRRMAQLVADLLVIEREVLAEDGRIDAGKGFCPGPLAAWRLHEILTGMDIACLLVDQSGWVSGEEPINDLNDLLQERGPTGVATALKLLETCAIPGLPLKHFRKNSRPRLWLPTHDFHAYGRYTVEPDFTRAIKEVKREEDGTEKIVFNDVAGFRIAAVSRVQIASPTSTMTGDSDNSPRTVFALSVQVARHGPVLQRRVVDDERLHNQDVWKKLGPIYAPTAFARLVNVWERASSIGERAAINFVGLAWRDGRVVVNEGPDCFFTDARQQCPYSDLVFPSGTLEHARLVLEQFQATFRDNAALILLVWGLGAHLKAFLGFWPHFVMQAQKGTGKSTLVKRLERAIAMVMSSRQSLQTEFRQLTSVSYTSHPVGWGEMSANKQEIINKAIHNLQECYQYEHTRRGADLIDYLLCAPVLLAGEDVPVSSLQGKVVRSELTLARRGPEMPQDLPVFPVKQWLQFLARQSKERMRRLHDDLSERMAAACVAPTTDSGAKRMVQNYAALAAAWHLLCEFTGLEAHRGNFIGSLTAEMNKHISETASDRQPWAWITEKLLSEIAQRTFRYPYAFSEVDEAPVLCVRTSHVMAHMSSTPTLREFWDGLPVKSDRVYKKMLNAPDLGTFKGIRDSAILHLLVGAGLRVSGLVSLNEGDLHRDVIGGRSRMFLRVIEKGDKERLVPLPREAESILLVYLGHEELAEIDRDTVDRHGRADKVLFVNTRNTTVAEHDHRGEERRLSRQAVHDLVQAYGQKLGIPVAHLHPHAMRHLYGTELTEEDVPTLTVQSLMGHADPKTTAIYTELSIRKKVRVVDEKGPLAKMKTPVSEMLKRLPQS